MKIALAQTLAARFLSTPFPATLILSPDGAEGAGIQNPPNAAKPLKIRGSGLLAPLGERIKVRGTPHNSNGQHSVATRTPMSMIFLIGAQMKIVFHFLILTFVAGCAPNDGPMQANRPPQPHTTTSTPRVNTFSIVAFDPATGELGVAVESKFFGVGSVVPWAKAGVGAIATQSAANVTYGTKGLDLLRAGKSAKEAVKLLTDEDAGRAIRQLGIVDANGNSASFTGAECQNWAGHKEGKTFCVQGNLLAGEVVVTAMTAAFEASQKVESSELADWLMAALKAGQAAGGDKRGKQSAALLVVRDRAGFGGANDRYIDLRVEDHPEPIQELSRLLEIHKQFYAGVHRNRPKRP